MYIVIVRCSFRRHTHTHTNRPIYLCLEFIDTAFLLRTQPHKLDSRKYIMFIVLCSKVCSFCIFAIATTRQAGDCFLSNISLLSPNKTHSREGTSALPTSDFRFPNFILWTNGVLVCLPPTHSHNHTLFQLNWVEKRGIHVGAKCIIHFTYLFFSPRARVRT